MGSNYLFYLLPIATFVAGFIAAYFYSKNASQFAKTTESELRSQLSNAKAQLEKEMDNGKNLSIQLAQLSTKYESLSSDYNNETRLNFNLKDENTELNEKLNQHFIRINILENEIDTLTSKLNTQKDEIEAGRKQTLLEFEALANKILEEKTQKFTSTNHEKMEQILNPLRENLAEFKRKVEETYDKESKERFTLESKIKELVQLNNQISKDANNLTNALKGQAKTQGNWGEMILESILQHSGLEKGREYFVQESYHDEDGNRKQPDIIIKYPDNRRIVIDSKVSLTAYERYVNDDDPESKELSLASHFQSIKNHIDNLSSKNYNDIAESAGFVMMFIPIEPAFLTVMHYDQEIWNYAYKKRIILISPTNLIAALKMIADIWKRELQNRNSEAIAKQGSALYDKFVGFVNDLEDIGNQLKKTTNSYDAAFNKLRSGRGNLISQVEKLKSMGLNTKKSIPEEYLFDSENQDLLEE